MRVQTQTFTANGQTSNTVTLLTGDTLAIVVSGSGNMTIQLQYQAESHSGTPWVPVALENSATNVEIATTVTGVRVVRGLPRGFYRLATTAFTSGTKVGSIHAY